MLIDVVEQVRRLAGSDSGLGAAARLSALNVPSGLYRILPLITIFAAVALFLALARSSELVVIRAAGRSALRLMLVPVTVAVLIGAAAVGVLNPLVAATSRQYDALSAAFFRGEQSVLSVGPEGVWLRQGSAGGQTVIRAARASLDGLQLEDVSFPDLFGRRRAAVAGRGAAGRPGSGGLAADRRQALDPDRSQSRTGRGRGGRRSTGFGPDARRHPRQLRGAVEHPVLGPAGLHPQP
jgi:lipopolysaccharide export system permease protein